MISFAEATEIIEKEFQALSLETESISLHESLYRTLAEDIFADSDFPSFNHSAVDGFAICLSAEKTSWKVLGEISAGNFSEVPMDEFSAVSIMTGAKLPANANAVIPIEDVETRDDTIFLKENISLKHGMNIRMQGSDCITAANVLSKNIQIHPNHISILAACGKDVLLAYKKLSIGALATGDELLPYTEKPLQDKIRATNIESLIEQVKSVRQSPLSFGITSDKLHYLRDALQKILFSSSIDILLTTGGVSVGAKDFVQEILLSLGAEIHFWKVRIKPGKPLLFATIQHQQKKIFVFGLPGNPVSAFVNFRIFVQPIIEKLFHQKASHSVFAQLSSPIKKKDDKRHFIRGCVEQDLTTRYVSVLENQSSGNMFGLSKANCLIVFPEEKIFLDKGEFVECILI